MRSRKKRNLRDSAWRQAADVSLLNKAQSTEGKLPPAAVSFLIRNGQQLFLSMDGLGVSNKKKMSEWIFFLQFMEKVNKNILKMIFFLLQTLSCIQLGFSWIQSLNPRENPCLKKLAVVYLEKRRSQKNMIVLKCVQNHAKILRACSQVVNLKSIFFSIKEES